MENERKNKISYRKVGDYYIPNLVLPKDKYADYKIGKYVNFIVEKVVRFSIIKWSIFHLTNTTCDVPKKVENVVDAGSIRGNQVYGVA